MHPIEAFVRHPVKTTVGVLLVALFGFVALRRMPVQLTPEVQIPTITVETRWPGASPYEVEREIVNEQEEQLQSVEGLTKLSSESRDSEGVITLEFRVGTNMQEALLKVNSRLQQVPKYPEDAREPVISTSDVASRPIAWFVLGPRVPTKDEIRAFQQELLARDPASEAARQLDLVIRTDNPGLVANRLRRIAAQHPEVQPIVPPEIAVTKLRRFVENQIEKQLERVDGVSNANVFGGEELELQVIVDPQKLAARQLTIGNVRDALRGENKDTSGGDFWEDKRRWIVRTLGQFRSPQQVESQILAIHDGAPVYVHDVADVRLGFKKPDGFVRRFGSPSISVNVQRETGANVLTVMQGIKQKVAELNAGVLSRENLVLSQVYDETDYIYSAIGLVNSNIVIGGVLTVCILLLFLRDLRTTMIIGLAIPTSIIGTFLILHMLGRSLNVISLAGLAFAVGMLVDNAVVVLENIFRRFQLGEAPMPASVHGTKEVWGAVLASTLTTLAVFLPVLFIQEEAGQLFRDIALAISAAIGLSLIVSVTVIPVAAARVLRRAPSEPGDEVESPTRHGRRPLRWFLDRCDRLAGTFVSLVVGSNAALQHSRRRSILVVAAMVAGSALVTWAAWPKVEYLPAGNRNLVFGILMPPPGYNLDELNRLGESIEKALQPYWDYDPLDPELDQRPFPPIADFFYVARGRNVIVGLRSVDPLRVRQLVNLVSGLQTQLPGTMVVANQSSLFERGLGAGRSIDIEITGPETRHLLELGRRIMAELPAVVPGAQSRPIPSLDSSMPEVRLRPKLVQSREMQISASELGYAVDALVDGAYATDYYTGETGLRLATGKGDEAGSDGGIDKIDLTIMGNAQYVQRTQDLEGLPLATPTGELVPLGAVADIQLGSGPEQLNHRERQRAITIQVNPPEDMALEDAIDRIRVNLLDRLEESGALGSQYVINLSGTADKLRETWQAFRGVMLLALLITYLLMAALFESWLFPLVIIVSVPLGVVGGVVALRLLSGYLILRGEPPQTLDVLTMLGFVILIGTVVNNAILIVHQALNHMREDGMTAHAAILESVRTRIRPIFMTTGTTVFGLLPLVFFPGAGSELYRGLGAVVLGGLAVSTVFTLIVIPTLFRLMLDARDALRRRSSPRAARRVDWSGWSEPAPQAERDVLEIPSD